MDMLDAMIRMSTVAKMPPLMSDADLDQIIAWQSVVGMAEHSTEGFEYALRLYLERYPPKEQP